MISHSKKFVFIHIIKTAGSSIHTALTSYAIKNIVHGHSPIIRYPNTVQNYYKFAFVRNPWDRMYSYYNFYKQNYVVTKEAMKNVGFSEWLMNPNFDFIFRSNEVVFPSKHFCQLNWLMDKNKNIMVDFIGRYENLENDFTEIKSKLDIETKPLGYINKTNHVPYREIYTDEEKEYVAEIAKEDIEYFKYKF